MFLKRFLDGVGAWPTYKEPRLQRYVVIPWLDHGIQELLSLDCTMCFRVSRDSMERSRKKKNLQTRLSLASLPKLNHARKPLPRLPCRVVRRCARSRLTHDSMERSKIHDTLNAKKINFLLAWDAVHFKFYTFPRLSINPVFATHHLRFSQKKPHFTPSNNSFP